MENGQLAQMWLDTQHEYTRVSGRDIEGLPKHVDEETLIESLKRQIQAQENFNNEEVCQFWIS